MAHIRSLLLQVVVMGLVAVAAASTAATTDAALPPMPSIPSIPPCMEPMIAPCAAAFGDNSTSVEPCCAAMKKVYKDDLPCVCNYVKETQKAFNVTQEALDAANVADAGEFDMFRKCKLPALTQDSCPGAVLPGSQKASAAPRLKSICAFLTVLLLPLFFLP